MVLLQSHYRSPVTITQENIEAAIKALAGLDSFAARTGRCSPTYAADPACSTPFRRGDGRRPRHAARRRRCCSTRCARPTRRSTPTTGRLLRSSPRRTRSPATFGLELGAVGRRARRGRRARGGTRRCSRREGLRDRRRDPCRAAGRGLDRRDRQAGHLRPSLIPDASRPPPRQRWRPAVSRGPVSIGNGSFGGSATSAHGRSSGRSTRSMPCA